MSSPYLSIHRVIAVLRALDHEENIPGFDNSLPSDLCMVDPDKDALSEVGECAFAGGILSLLWHRCSITDRVLSFNASDGGCCRVIVSARSQAIPGGGSFAVTDPCQFAALLCAAEIEWGVVALVPPADPKEAPK